MCSTTLRFDPGDIDRFKADVLLGGPVRRELGFSEYSALRVPSATEPGETTPLEVARYCARMRQEHGSTLFEGKVGVLDLDPEDEMVREVRAAIGPDATLRLDANNVISQLGEPNEMHYRPFSLQ